MMSNRREKLELLKQQKVTQKTVVVDVSSLADVLEEHIVKFKALFDAGIDIKATNLIQELSEVKGLVPSIERFTNTLNALNIPDNIDLNIPESAELIGAKDIEEAIRQQNVLLRALNIPETIELKGIDDLGKIFKIQAKLLASVKIPEVVELDGLPNLVKLIDKYIQQINKLEATLGKEKTVNVDFANDKGIEKITDALDNLTKKILENTPKQDASDFIPVRRVRKVINRLVFDDGQWISGNSGGGGIQNSLIDNDRVKVDANVTLDASDIEIGAVELKNGSDDTRATVTAANALKVDGSAVTQPVSGTVTATPTGTQNVDVTANTIGLATSANQQTDALTNTELRAMPVPVSATSLPLPTGAATSALQTQPGVDIGDVTINNAAGAAAVNIQDGGNSITVDGSLTANPTVPTAVVAFVTAVTTAGVRVQLGSNALTGGAILQAPSTNTGLIYVGVVTVSATVYGAELQPGQATSFAGNNTNLIYIDASVSGDKMSVLGS